MTIKSLLIVAIPAILTVAISVPFTQAQVNNVTVAVEGMSCPFCAFGVEKKLKNVEGVESVEISMKEGKAVLTAKRGQSINISHVPKAVRDSGFSPGTISIRATGTITEDKQKGLLMHFNGHSLLLTGLTARARERLLALKGSGRTVEVNGIARENPDGTWALSPESIKEM